MKNFNKYLFSLFTVVIFFTLTAQSRTIHDSLQWTPKALNMAPAFGKISQNHHLPEINDLDEFESLAKITESLFGKEVQVKVVYQRSSVPGNSKLYFINTELFPFHSYFVNQSLNLNIPDAILNTNYTGTGEFRDFNFGTLTISPRKNGNKTEILFDIWNGDSLEGKYLEEFYQVINQKMKASNFSLVFRTLSDLHEKNSASTSIPKTNNQEVYAGREYWPLSIPKTTCDPSAPDHAECVQYKGSVVGYIRVVDEIQAGTMEQLEPSDIVVFLKDLPNEIGFVSGIVTKAFQTPLSHINIKSKNRGTANIAHFLAESIFPSMNGKFVRIYFGVDDLKIVDLDHLNSREKLALSNEYLTERQPSLNEEIIAVDSRSNPKELVDLKTWYSSQPNRNEHSELIQTVGAKAANLALLNFVSNTLKNRFYIEVPEALALPFYYYDLFMSQEVEDATGNKVKLRDYVLNELESNGLLLHGLKTRQSVEPVLNRIRAKYLEVKVPDEILNLFEEAIVGTNTNSPIHQSKRVTRLRLRSSTNSEDLEGFTGAGLYESAGINLYKKDKTNGGYIDEKRSWKKIKKDLQEEIPAVFSGVWNTRAFMERDWFQLYGDNHLKVKAALAIHGAFPFQGFNSEVYEVANGVVATKNIYKEDNGSGIGEIYINAQHWDFSITNPPTNEELEERDQSTDIDYRTEESLITAYANDPQVLGRNDEYRWWFAQNISTSSIETKSSFVCNGETAVLCDDPTYDGGAPHSTPHQSEILKMEKRRLSGAFTFLKELMTRVYQKRGQANYHIEGEWKIIGPERKIVIKQMREFALPNN